MRIACCVVVLLIVGCETKAAQEARYVAARETLLKEEAEERRLMDVWSVEFTAAAKSYVDEAVARERQKPEEERDLATAEETAKKEFYQLPKKETPAYLEYVRQHEHTEATRKSVNEFGARLGKEKAPLPYK